MIASETVYRGNGLVVYRVNGKPRDPERGGRAEVVAYVAGVTPARIVGLLREAADRLEKNLPRGES